MSYEFKKKFHQVIEEIDNCQMRYDPENNAVMLFRNGYAVDGAFVCNKPGFKYARSLFRYYANQYDPFDAPEEHADLLNKQPGHEGHCIGVL